MGLTCSCFDGNQLQFEKLFSKHKFINNNLNNPVSIHDTSLGLVRPGN